MDITLINIERIDGETVSLLLVVLAWLIDRGRKGPPPPSDRLSDERPTSEQNYTEIGRTSNSQVIEIKGGKAGS